MGDQPSIIISFPGPVDDVVRRRATEAVEAWMETGHRVLVLGDGARVEHVSYSLTPMPFDTLAVASSVGRGTRLMTVVALGLSSAAVVLSLQ